MLIKMYRSTSVARASNEYLVSFAAAASAAKTTWAPKMLMTDDLPTYNNNPSPDVPKKESSHNLSREKAIHLVPLLLVACFLILWLFSKPIILGAVHSS